jgi:hypothetical protein
MIFLLFIKIICNILNGLGNTVNAIFRFMSICKWVIVHTNTNPNSYSIVSLELLNILNSSNSVMAGAFNNSENSTSTGIFGTV